MSRPFSGAAYWERRYADGRTSGAGSEGERAVAKAERVNAVIREYDVWSVIDWGCGDGTVLKRITPGVHYLGVDISPTVLDKVTAEHSRRSFLLDTPGSRATQWLRADMALSMDVLFHLTDEADYRTHLLRLFGCARSVVLVYATDYDGGRTARHVLRRRWTPDVADRFPAWRIAEAAADPAEPGFYLYLREG